jgi:hypothetical protein
VAQLGTSLGRSHDNMPSEKVLVFTVNLRFVTEDTKEIDLYRLHDNKRNVKALLTARDFFL